jgi:CheY-like chemotaxis protein
MSKLLVAEANEFSRDMLVRRLQRSGYDVIAASDGREALHTARLERPDVILMDLDLPVMDGHEVIRALVNDPRSFRIPVIVVSANASPEDVSKALDAGCKGYETKPVVFRRLLEQIERALAESAQPKTVKAATPAPSDAEAPSGPDRDP